MDERILELSERARQNGLKYPKRRIYGDILKESGKKVFLGIAGLRGCGKTILLSQLLAELKDAVYVSCDQVGQTLYSLAQDAEKSGVKCLLVDEISYLPKWRKDLKRIYDFTGVKVVFTSSSAIDVLKSNVDLSRRVNLFFMHPFTFLEYLQVAKQVEVKCLAAYTEKTDVRLEAYFSEYCSYGALPASAEGAKAGSIVDKVIESDLVRYEKLSWEEILEVKKMFSFICNSTPEDLSYSGISRNIGVSKYKTQRYVKLLSDSFLLHVLAPVGRNVMKEPKIYVSLPFRPALSRLPEPLLKGVVREEFLVTNLVAAGKTPRYIKGSRGQKVPDFYLDGTVIEVGGKGKSRMQFKGIGAKASKVIATFPGEYAEGRVPLISFGLLC